MMTGRVPADTGQQLRKVVGLAGWPLAAECKVLFQVVEEAVSTLAAAVRRLRQLAGRTLADATQRLRLTAFNITWVTSA